MNTFVMHLQSATQYERIDNVESFVGEDDSGNFGILAGHERMMTILTYGLARYRRDTGEWVYAAVPGAVLYNCDNEVFISTRRYFTDPDYNRISGELLRELMVEEQGLQATRDSLERLEQEMLRRLRELARGRG
jgi:F-type H+-transporting ATPase subunit epsilon